MISKQELEQMYCNEKMSPKEIADTVGCCRTTIHHKLISYDIPMRNLSEVRLKGKHKPSKEELAHMYHNKKMSTCTISENIGVTSMTVFRWLRSYDITTRNRETCGELHPDYKEVCTYQELREMYLVMEMTAQEIADTLQCSCSLILRRLKSHDIPIRSNWKGGITPQPYCKKFNNKFKEAVRERDDYTCQLCGCEQEDNGRRLSVHHIHYDKENCYPDVIALCNACNVKVNVNREYWEKYFEDLLIEHCHFCWSMGDT